jgi:hypothetical protein
MLDTFNSEKIHPIRVNHILVEGIDIMTDQEESGMEWQGRVQPVYIVSDLFLLKMAS